jgi:acetolactate synthase-1/2/3 large subunit
MLCIDMKKSKEIMVSDFVLKIVESMGVKYVFGVTGGAISWQLDAFSRNPNLTFITMQHEQAAAMAVEAYSRIKGYGVGMSTSGPGGTNMITGVCGCWFDSIPALFITGQVSTFDQKKNNVRQRGFQEATMVELMKPITKFSVLENDPNKIPETLAKAINESISGRKGPVHIDLPLDIQQSKIQETKVKIGPKKEKDKIDYKSVLRLIKNAKRPVLVVGNGVRLSGATQRLKELADLLNWPILPSWAYADFMHKNRIDLFGVYGNRGANFTVQNSDLILAIGTRLDTRMTGSNPKQFAREAKKIIVDIDINEINKGVVIPDVPIKTDALVFLEGLLKNKIVQEDKSDWLNKCKSWQDEYEIIKSQRSEDKTISPYVFVRMLSDIAKEDEIVVTDTGANLAWMMQAWKFKSNQNLFSSFGNSPMGYSLPAAIGACFASGKRVICTNGDGGIQMNIQELQTIVNYNLPVKIFVFSNHGYGMIRQFQDLYLGNRHVGSDEGIPDFKKIGQAYGIKSYRIDDLSKMREGVKEALDYEGAVIVDVILDTKALIEPRAIFGKPIEEQSPFLPDDEVQKHLIVERWKKP